MKVQKKFLACMDLFVFHIFVIFISTLLLFCLIEIFFLSFISWGFTSLKVKVMLVQV